MKFCYNKFKCKLVFWLRYIFIVVCCIIGLILLGIRNNDFFIGGVNGKFVFLFWVNEIRSWKYIIFLLVLCV